MDIQLEKLELIKKLLETNDIVILNTIKKIFSKENGDDFWEKLTDEQQNMINESLTEYKKGHYRKFNDFVEDIE